MFTFFCGRKNPSQYNEQYLTLALTMSVHMPSTCIRLFSCTRICYIRKCTLIHRLCTGNQCFSFFYPPPQGRISNVPQWCSSGQSIAHMGQQDPTSLSFGPMTVQYFRLRLSIEWCAQYQLTARVSTSNYYVHQWMCFVLLVKVKF